MMFKGDYPIGMPHTHLCTIRPSKLSGDGHPKSLLAFENLGLCLPRALGNVDK